MSIELLPYAAQHAAEWDCFCASSLQGTLLHTRRFLSYHGERFDDFSLLVKEDGVLVGVFPAALSPTDPSCVVSHPGITYGGLVHHGRLRGERMIKVLMAIRQRYMACGFNKLIYKTVPAIYHQSPAQDDLYALFRLGGRRTRCDLSSTINVARRLAVSERRKRGWKKAERAGVLIVTGCKHLPEFWQVLTENLQRKHGVTPVHTLDEIQLLARCFPDAITLVAASVGDRIEAGGLLFRTPVCDHVQYIASSVRGRQIGALDAVFEHCIGAAEKSGKQWFDFGICTEDDGMVLNDGLYRFKSEFGGGGEVYEIYELNFD